MSVRCEYCGEGAGYGREIGHRSDCPTLREYRPSVNNAESEKARAMQMARWIVEKHMRDFDCYIKHPDILKKAIAEAIFNFAKSPIASGARDE